jgi:hypothetical protein
MLCSFFVKRKKFCESAVNKGGTFAVEIQLSIALHNPSHQMSQMWGLMQALYILHSAFKTP